MFWELFAIDTKEQIGLPYQQRRRERLQPPLHRYLPLTAVLLAGVGAR